MKFDRRGQPEAASRAAPAGRLAIPGFVFLCVAVAMLIAALSFFDWSHDPGPMVEGVPVAGQCPEDATASHFPVGSFLVQAGDDRSDAGLRRHLSRPLAAMQEAPLWCGADPTLEVYRLTYLRSFHDQMTIRVFAEGNGFRLRAVVMPLDDQLQYGAITHRIDQALAEEDWELVRAARDEIDFRQTPPGESAWFDGAGWIFEARVNGRYQVVERHTGDAPLPAFALRLMDLAGIRPPEDELY